MLKKREGPSLSEVLPETTNLPVSQILFTTPVGDPPTLNTPAAILARCELIRKNLDESRGRNEKETRVACLDKDFGRYLRGDFGEAHLLPTVEPLWTAAQAIDGVAFGTFPGEPKTLSEAFTTLDAIIGWCKSTPAPNGLTLIPGGFSHRGKTHNLSGRPLAMLQALLSSPGRRCTADRLRELMGIDDLHIEHPEQAVKDAAGDLRAALRLALKSGSNPLPSTGAGPNLTYCLDLPR